MITIDANAGLVTVINHCTVRPDQQQAFTDAWIGCLDGIRRFPGFVSAAVHRGQDGTRVTTYLQWRTRADHERCLAETDWSGAPEQAFRALMDDGSVTIEPFAYDVVHVAEGAA